MVSNVEQVVADRLPLHVTVKEVVWTGPVPRCVVTPFDRNDRRNEKEAQDHK